MSIKTISVQELQKLREAQPNAIILDVLPEDSFGEVHIARARNACVYRIDFLDRCGEIIGDLRTPLVVYGLSAASMASSTAAEKLARAGYVEVYDFKGGLGEWTAAGLPVEAGDGKTSPESREVSLGGTFAVDTEPSRVHWSGRNFGSEHTGTLRLSGGQMRIENGQLVSGEFTIDMDSMANDDIDDSQMRQVLIDHLKSDDFFDVRRFPDARFVIAKAILIADAAPPLRFHVVGKLTIKGRTNDISFPCRVQHENSTLVADAQMEIDRTRWNVIYGSTRFYEMLGKHFVGDVINLRLHIEAESSR